MQKIHNFLKLLLGLILACHIRKFDSSLTGHIDFGAALSKRHGISHTAAHPFHQHPGQKLPDQHEDRNLNYDRKNRTEQRSFLFPDFAEFTSGCLQTVHQIRVIEGYGGIERRIFFVVIHKIDIILFHLRHGDLFFLQHVQKRPVIHFLNLFPDKSGKDNGI